MSDEYISIGAIIIHGYFMTYLFDHWMLKPGSGILHTKNVPYSAAIKIISNVGMIGYWQRDTNLT